MYGARAGNENSGAAAAGSRAGRRGSGGGSGARVALGDVTAQVNNRGTRVGGKDGRAGKPRADAAVQGGENVEETVTAVGPVWDAAAEAAVAAAAAEYGGAPDPADEDTWDAVMVAEYAPEIFAYLRGLEARFAPAADYMREQPELRWEYRATLVDWLVQVHCRFQLLPETLYLTINIIDRFLSRKTVTLNRFQLVGAAALFIASKYEEINCPTLRELLYMLDNAYTADEVLKAERYMIDTLEFEFGWPGPMSFLRRVSKSDNYEYDIRTLAKYLLETTIMDPRLVAAPPSWLAAGAYYLSRIIIGYNTWTRQHIFYSGYTAEQLVSLATVILENCRHAETRHQAIFEKYSKSRHRRSAQVVARWIAMAEENLQPA
ncbi:AaceriADR068Wp [[Ashbya] aceris (nom. inval.)]|nr:AaceriADR068Wp [[Ashbya] aceris (nom. inval.)]